MSERTDALYQTLAELTALDGVSGFEQPVVRALRDALTPLVDEIEIDTMGNLYARKRGGDGPTLMISAHSDEIGAVVKSIEPNGFLRFDTLGGVIPALLNGRRVRVGGHLGVIGCKSGHLQSPEEQRRVVPPDDLYIDVCADSADEVSAMGIEPGTPVAYHSPLMRYARQDRVCGKSIDNRIGCAIVLQTMRELADADLPGDLLATICVQEEIGLRGAQVAGFHAQPDCAVVVDTFMSGDTPDVDRYRELPAAIGKGPVLLLANSAHMGHPAMHRHLRAAAERARVPLQLTTLVGKAGTDAGTIYLSGHGVPTAGLGLARRYSHSPICTLDLSDGDGAVAVLCEMARGMRAGLDLSFLGA